MNVVAKYKERIQARELRQAGESIGIIGRKLGVAKSTVSSWCSDISLSEEQIRKLASRGEIAANIGRLHAAENRRRERQVRVKYYGDIGLKRVGKMKDRDLFMLGVGLYWAEGCKKDRNTKFINSDPVMIKLWMKWLLKFTNVKRKDFLFRIGISQIHRRRIDKVTSYWSKVVGAPETQFGWPSFKKVVNRKVYANFEDHYGTLMVTVRRGTNLNYEILGMIKAAGNFEAGSW